MNKLESFMRMEGLNSSQVAQVVGVHRSVIHKVLKGEVRMSAEMAVKLSEAFGGSAWSWYEGQAMRDIEKARKEKEGK